MLNNQNQPKHSWLITNRLIRAFAWLALFIFIIAAFAVWGIRYSIRRDCNDVYIRRLEFGGYWLNIRAGSTELDCPNA